MIPYPFLIPYSDVAQRDWRRHVINKHQNLIYSATDAVHCSLFNVLFPRNIKNIFFLHHRNMCDWRLIFIVIEWDWNGYRIVYAFITTCCLFHIVRLDFFFFRSFFFFFVSPRFFFTSVCQTFSAYIIWWDSVVDFILISCTHPFHIKIYYYC